MNDRRTFLTGGRHEIRPPWSIATELFFKACTRCHQCINACPTAIIGKDRFGYPLLDFSKGECLFCQKCLEVCPTNALTSSKSPWNHAAAITENCLAHQGILCGLCGEVCETSAITFQPQQGSAAPAITDTCTGCGACVRSCPVQAIFIR